MTIKSIHIYPIKGLGGVELQEAKVQECGLQYDRRWMLVDMEGNFISQRNDSRLALFHCDITDQLEVSYNGDRLNIDLQNHNNKKILTTVWEHEVYAYEVSEEASSWFCKVLDLDCMLVRMTDDHDRYKELIKGPKQTRVSFADGYPIQILGTASVDNLCKVADQEIPSNRFRSNIIIETNTAHEEDAWDEIVIGSTTLKVIKPCARCLVINIDQTSAETNKEPLKSLSIYRMVDNVVNFGANSICLQEGIIRVGDTINMSDPLV